MKAKVMTLQLLVLLSALYTQVNATSSTSVNATSSTSVNTPYYDFIVVGGGASGCVVSDKLSESGKYKVLTIEHGGPSQRDLGGTDFVASDLYYDSKGVLQVGIPYTRYDVPAFILTTWSDPTPTPIYPLVSTTGITNSNAVKLLGGSQSHNAMGWMRGTLSTFDTYWKIPGFGSADALKYYRMSENVTGPMYDNLYPSYHGRLGKTQVSFGYTNFSLGIKFFQACQKAGYTYINDIHGPEPRLGCGNNVYNVREGVRDTTAMAHLKGALLRPNYALRLWTQVTKVLFNSSGAAIGVEIKDATGVKSNIYARKEVILAAGTLNTAKLLMLSGVGDSSVLSKFGIPIVYNNTQVGKNLRNHHYCYAVWEYKAADQPPFWGNTPSYSLEYAMYGTGAWATPEFNLATLWEKSNATIPETDIYVSINSGGDPQKVNIMLATTMPDMNGYVTITSSDPSAPFQVELDFAKYPSDINRLKVALAHARRLMNASSDDFGEEIEPGNKGDADDEAWIRSNCGVQAHWMGTAKMATNKKEGVVDPSFRVYGVSGLRVVDASFFPSFVSGQLQSSIIAWAHKAAEVILATYP